MLCGTTQDRQVRVKSSDKMWYTGGENGNTFQYSCLENSMNQGKVDVIKQEMLRINIDILEISELKWMGMDEFNSDDHYMYYCGQESLRKNRVAHIVNRRV